MDKEQVFMKLLEFEDTKTKKVIIKLFNFYKDMENIKDDMTEVLNLLDEISEDCDNKKLMRTKILDSYNTLPRDTLKLINDFANILKE